ncbi:MAG: methyltransferase domain-containing protein [bacterium]
MSNTTKEAVKSQFSKQAEFYSRSTSHSEGESLELMVTWAEPKTTDIVLDIATGTGFTAFAFSPHVTKVVATDMTQAMLEQAEKLSKERNLSNIEFKLAEAESLPFGDNEFDIVTCRIAPHHFSSIEKFLSEAKRVVKSTGRILIADTTCPENLQVAKWQNEVEKLRDPSHVYNYSLSSWNEMIGKSELKLEKSTIILSPIMSFSDWVERSGSNKNVILELRKKFLEAPSNVKEIFGIKEENGEIFFYWKIIVLKAIK